MNRSWWGWGFADRAADPAEVAKLVRAYLPLDGTITPIPEVPALRPPRVDTPFETTPSQRAAHTYGKAYRDVVRNLRGELTNPPDAVAFPGNESEVLRTLEWASARDVAVIPYGGGTSVVGGVEFRDPTRPFITLSLSRLNNVLEVDETNLAMRAQGGILGPAIEDALRPLGLTLRHFPQSFEFSSLGGWIATRAGGHFATGHTHIDDFVASLTVLTPCGASRSLRVPASGAGPSPDRLFLGSEGALGVISEAWIRVRRRPAFRSAATVRFESFPDAVTATREIAQSGLSPANCRLLDPFESMLGASVSDGGCRLILAFESAHFPTESDLDSALELCRNGEVAEGGSAWRDTFLRAPYLRDALVRLGVVVETFETACTWTAFPALHEALLEALAPAIVTCRFTHVYPDGPAPYFTVYAPGRRGAEVQIWDELKAKASEVLLAHGASITHHHAVGRDHAPFYSRQRPDLFAEMLRAAKTAIDPRGVLNPGVLGL